MARLILLALAVFILVWLVRRAFRDRQGEAPPAPKDGAALVACAHCGVHLPRLEARRAGGEEHYYCSEEHARRGPRRS